MKLLIYGEVDEVGSGVWCYSEACKELQLEVIPFHNDRSIKKYTNNIFWRIVRRLNNRKILEKDRLLHSNALIESVQKNLPNIIVIFKGILLDRNEIKILKRYCPFVVIVNHDDFYSKSKNSVSEIQFLAIPEYDYVFTTKEINIQEIHIYNPRIAFFPFSYHPQIHYKYYLSANDKLKYSVDIVFIGTYEKERAKLLENILLNTNYTVAIYGGSWHLLSRNSKLHKNIKSYNGLRFDEMCKAIQCAKISLGFLRKSNRDTFTQRSFEIPACGGLLLAERTELHMKLFQEGIEAEFFNPNDPVELVNKIHILMNDEKRRQSISNAGYNKVTSSGFTYKNRIQQILDAYNSHKR